MSAILPIVQDQRYRLSTAVGGETSYAVPFPFQANVDIVVQKIAVNGTTTTLVEGPDYSLTGAGNPAGGGLSLVVPMAAGQKLLRVGRAVLDRVTSIERNGKFSSRAIDDDIDRWILIAQEQRRDIGRTIRVPFGLTGPLMTPGTTGQMLAFDAAGNLQPTDPHGMAFKRNWSGLLGYLTNAVVRQGGSLYIALRPNIGVTPGTSPDDWDIFIPGSATADGSVSELAVVTDPTDALRLTISHLGYPKGLDRTGDTGAAAANRIAIQSKLDNKYYVELGQGIICVDNAVVLGGSGKSLVGEGENASILKNTSAGNPTVKVTSGSNNIAVYGMTLDRTSLGTFGGDGIDFAKGGIADGLIHNIYSKNNYNGIGVGAAGYSRAYDIFCERNANDGINITNSNANTTCQWYMRDILCQLNGGDGFRIQSVASVVGHMALGELVGCRSFANSGRGLIALGNANCGVYSLRVANCFFGEDGGDEVYLDTYGNLHTFENCWLELGGSTNTGPLYATPPSHASFGFVIMPNTPDVTISGGKINGMAKSGVYSACPNDGAVRVNGTLIANNGINGGSSDADTSALVTIGGAFDLVGVRAYGQRIGLLNASTGGDQIIGCDFNGNSVAKVSGNTTGNVTAGNR